MRIVRPMEESDKSFIYSTWLRSQYYGNTWFKSIDKDIFFDNYKKIVEARLLSADVWVSCLESDHDVVLGYSVSEGSTLHWVYVKRAWRRLGVAKELVTLPPTVVTSMTKIGKLVCPNESTFNPFI